MAHSEQSSIDRYTRKKWDEEAARAERSQRRSGLLYFIMAGASVLLFLLRTVERGGVEPRMWWGVGVALLFVLMGRRARRWRYPPYPEPR